MLKQRIITALVLAPLIIGLILAAPTPIVALVLAIIILLAAHEWAILGGLHGYPKYAFVLLTAVLLLTGWHYRTLLISFASLVVVSGFWLLLTLTLIMRRKAVELFSGVSVKALLAGMLLLPFAWLSIVSMHEIRQDGSHLVLAVLLLIWIADIGAYFSGRAFGRHKLAPEVSPGKTWEGVLGALAGAAIFAWLLQQHSLFVHIPYPFLLLLCVTVALLSIGGDLFESLIKRQRGVKDSSNLLPGHGGIFDRIDSLIAASPVFLLGIMWLQVGVQ